MPQNIYVYECTTVDDRTVLVAFYDDHIGQNHDQPVGRTRAKIRFDWRHAFVTPIITEIDQSEPVTERLQTQNGQLYLDLTEYPVFLERGS